MAVNLSGQNFIRKNLLGIIAGVIYDTRLDPHYLELELTESVLMKNARETATTLRVLKDMGLHISIDDFGTGYSSLSYLKRFPLDTLKIDQSFIREVTSDPDNAAITTAIIAMAHSLNCEWSPKEWRRRSSLLSSVTMVVRRCRDSSTAGPFRPLKSSSSSRISALRNT